jgi:molybdate transport system substrate-binding protein
MAPKSLVVTLAKQFSEKTAVPVNCEAAGGVDVIKRIEAGEIADLVVLARASIDEFVRAGHVLPETRDIAKSDIAVAVRAGSTAPDITSETTLRAAVEEAVSVSYSTGPSGVHIEKTFAAWGLLEKLRPRIVIPPPGLSVGVLVATGKAAIGFQQRSELISIDGIRIIGALPGSMQLLTVFAGAVLSRSPQPAKASKLLGFIAAPEHDAVRRRFGMESPRIDTLT